MARFLSGPKVGAFASLWVAVWASQARGIEIETSVPVVYHYQVTDYYCAAASMEMMLDTPAVRNNNAFVNQMLMAADDPGVAHGAPPPTPTYANGQVTSNPQAAIYNLVHGLATYTNPVNGNAYSYLNPFAPAGAGTDSNAIQYGLNVLDNPAVGANGIHNYVAYNVPSTLAYGALASRTIANAISDYSVPAQITIGNGAHAICVTGVTTLDSLPGRNQNYTITGFYVNDPWTGWVASQVNAGRPMPAGGWGLGVHTWLRYGYDVVPGNALINVPGQGATPARLGAWFNYFNPAPGQPGAGAYMSGAGFKFVVEPQGPEALDDGNGGQYYSLPAPPPLLGSALNASSAAASAVADLAGESNLNNEPGLEGGAFDGADAAFFHMPGDTGTEGDWLVPYDGSGGINDVTGALLIDSLTGVIDEATWIDPTVASEVMSLSEVDTMFGDLSAGILPNDNTVPEPAGAALALPALMLLQRRKR